MNLADSLCKTAAQHNELLVEILAAMSDTSKKGRFYMDLKSEWLIDELWYEVRLYLEKCGLRVVMNTSTRYISNVGPRIYWV